MTAPTRPPRTTAKPRPERRLSSADMAAQLVADIIHRKADDIRKEREAEHQAVVTRRRRGRAWYFLGAVPLLLGLTAWNIVRATHPPAPFTPDERESGIRFQMYLTVQAIEAYRDSAGRWPNDLRAVGMEDLGFVYQRQDAWYEISDTSSAVPLVYRSGDPLEPFAAGFVELQHARLGKPL